jgi:hypothetical protein
MGGSWPVGKTIWIDQRTNCEAEFVMQGLAVRRLADYEARTSEATETRHQEDELVGSPGAKGTDLKDDKGVVTHESEGCDRVRPPSTPRIVKR